MNSDRETWPEYGKRLAIETLMPWAIGCVLVTATMLLGSVVLNACYHLLIR